MKILKKTKTNLRLSAMPEATMAHWVSTIFGIRPPLTSCRHLLKMISRNEVPDFPFPENPISFHEFRLPVISDVLHAGEKSYIGNALLELDLGQVLIVSDSNIPAAKGLYACALLETADDATGWLEQMTDQSAIIRTFGDYCLIASPLKNFV